MTGFAIPAGRRMLRHAAPALAALVAQWLLHLRWAASPFVPNAIGDWLIRRAPGDVATEAIERLGKNAGHLLALGVTAGILATAVALPRARPLAATAAAVLVTLVAIAIDPVPVQRRFAILATAATAIVAGLAAQAALPRPGTPYLATRRRVLAGGGLALAALGMGGMVLARPGRRSASIAEAVADGTFTGPPGLSPRITPPDDHYVVDINLNRPVLDGGSWRLRVDGDVAQPRSFSFEEIRALPAVAMPVHLHCISNPVGGTLMSNARWTVAPMPSLLALAMPSSSVDAIRITAADDYDETISMDEAAQVLVAYEMSGRALPATHGYPVRLLFPGRYGMRSVKWVTRLELVSKAGEGYWERRGWTDDAIMRTGSRIDTPRKDERVPRQTVAAGVAWGGTRGVKAVEISGDGGRTWQLAELEPPAGPLTWVRWRAPLELARGANVIAVRATDGEGVVQDAEERFPHPSGASGYHRVSVRAL